MAEEQQQAETSAPRWRLPLILALLVLVIGSIFARQSRAGEKTTRDAAVAAQLAPGETAPAEEPGTLDIVLPYLTECGVAMLLGLTLGLATRFLLKALVVILVLIFVGVHFLGIEAPDWGAGVVWVRDYVLHIAADDSIGGLVQRKLPAAAALFLGYALGLKRD